MLSEHNLFHVQDITPYTRKKVNVQWMILNPHVSLILTVLKR